MPPTKKKSSSASSSAASSSAAAALLAELDETDDIINWMQNPHSTATSDVDPALPPLLSHLSSLDSALTCPICHATPLSIPVTLSPCSHTFCSLCLQSNLRSQRGASNGTTTNTSCPVCRTKCDDRDVVRNATLEVVCGIWGEVRGTVRDRMWSSSVAAVAGSSGVGSGNDENDADDIDNGDSKGGGKKRAAAAVSASSSSASASSSSSAAAGGGRKRPRRSAPRRADGYDDGNSSSSSDEDSGEEYQDNGEESSSDTDVEFVSKSGGGGGGGGGSNNGKRKAPPAAARSASTAAASSKSIGKRKSKPAKSYPSDAEHLAAIGSTIDPAALDRTRSLPGNLTGLKRPQMVRLLSSYGLSTSGPNLDVLKDRYRAFRMLYNAQGMSARPAPIAQLVAQVHAEERARDRERKLAVMNGSGRVADEMRRLNAKWNEEKVDGNGGEEVGGGNGGGTSSRAADIPDKMKTGFAALLAEGRRRCKEQGWRMGEREDATDAAAAAAAGDGSGKKKRKWEDDDEVGAQEEKKDDDDAEEPIVLDDGSDDDEDEDDRKPSAVEAAASRAAEDSINGPQGAMNEAIGDGDDEAQISRSPSSESPRTVRASSSSDGLVGSASASSSASSVSASASASAKKSSSAKKTKPSPRRSYQQTPQPRQCQPASVDTRSIRNNSTPSTIGPWSCGACTFYNEINIGSRDKCEVCETPRPRPISRPSRNVASFDC